MGLEDVRKALKNTELESEIFLLPHTGNTVDHAADAIGCDPDQIAKTISFLVGETPIVIVVSGLSRVDNKKYKNEFSKKAKMIPFLSVEDLVGHPPGGVNPFGVKENVEVYLDESLKKHSVVYPAAGDENYAIKVPLPLMEQLSGYKKYVDVTNIKDE